MVTIKCKFKSHGAKGRWFSQEVRTEAEAKQAKKFIGNEGIVKIIRHRKPAKIRRSSNPFTTSFKLPKIRF